MGIMFKWSVQDYVVLTLLSLMGILPFLGVFYQKIDLSITNKTVRWESARWPYLAIRWQEPFANYSHLVIEETSPSFDWAELLYYRPDRLALLRKGKYDQVSSRLVHIMLYHPGNHAKYSVSLACFSFSESEKVREYAAKAHKLLGLPVAILKNGHIEEISAINQNERAQT